MQDSSTSTSTSSDVPKKPIIKSTVRRDRLETFELEMQDQWEKAKLFEFDAPAENATPQEKGEKFLATFPYPYMNGRLHIGHGFSLSKSEFATRFERLRGKKSLWPFGFHCTGMPIASAALKLSRELKKYGNPPVFPTETISADSVKTHAKILAKEGNKKFQYQILQSMQVEPHLLEKFVDPDQWLSYFPEKTIIDLKKFGVHVDWRRSFITTDRNPFYDSFIKWQFTRLKEQGRIKFGKRMSIYNPSTKQVCLDHDRSSGEKVRPEDLTCILLELAISDYDSKGAIVSSSPSAKYEPRTLPPEFLNLDGPVYFGAATLRPETMVGQTNCWVSPTITYGIFDISPCTIDANGNPSQLKVPWTGKRYLVCTDHAALNLAHQGYGPVFGKPTRISQIEGTKIMGLPLFAPSSPYERIFMLPMTTIKPTRGTGIVTSVPADAPDDYAAFIDLLKDDKMMKKFNLNKKWYESFKLIPIIKFNAIPGDETSELITISAKYMYEKLKIQSQKDRVQLDDAKDYCYKMGFNHGIMTAGPYAGQKVNVVKDQFRLELIQKGHAIPYSEPSSLVISRTGHTCVACLTDQWYLTYNDAEWKQLAHKNLEKMRCYNEETHKKIFAAIDWLREWACSRQYGLGTHLPWDDVWLIDSLSDSTIYMAYYTFCHLLHTDFNGKVLGPSGLTPQQMTSAAWDYIFSLGDGSGLGYTKQLDLCKREFQYWYPVDLRVSAHELIPNHLSFFLFNHTSIFPEKCWPVGMRCNGHMLLNHDKMSKSTGNFLTISDACKKYSADAARAAIADAGDGFDDANFEEFTANSIVNSLTIFTDNCYNFMNFGGASPTSQIRSSGPVTDLEKLADSIFSAEIETIIENSYDFNEKMLYKAALGESFYRLERARDFYFLMINSGLSDQDISAAPRIDFSQVGTLTTLTQRETATWLRINPQLFDRFVSIFCILNSIFCPHTCDFCFKVILKKNRFASTEKFPIAQPVKPEQIGISEYISLVSDLIKNQINKQRKSLMKKSPNKLVTGWKISVYVNSVLPEWKKIALETAKTLWINAQKTGEEIQVKKLFPQFKANCLKGADLKKLTRDQKLILKNLMPYVNQCFNSAKDIGQKAFVGSLPFDEALILNTALSVIQSTLPDVESIQVVSISSMSAADLKKNRVAQIADPGFPTCSAKGQFAA